MIDRLNPGVQERPVLVRRFPKMQAPLREGKKRETLGRAKGVKRTGRSLLFGLLLVGIATGSSLFYTWERLVVESVLDRNLKMETDLELIRSKVEILIWQVTTLEATQRLEMIAQSRLGMTKIDWGDVTVIEQVDGDHR